MNHIHVGCRHGDHSGVYIVMILAALGISAILPKAKRKAEAADEINTAIAAVESR